MPSITIKNVPEDLYERLKVAARNHHRSMNREVIACLDKQLKPSIPTEDEHVRAARELQRKYGTAYVSSEVIVQAIREGRDHHD